MHIVGAHIKQQLCSGDWWVHSAHWMRTHWKPKSFLLDSVFSLIIYLLLLTSTIFSIEHVTHAGVTSGYRDNRSKPVEMNTHTQFYDSSSNLVYMSFSSFFLFQKIVHAIFRHQITCEYNGSQLDQKPTPKYMLVRSICSRSRSQTSTENYQLHWPLASNTTNSHFECRTKMKLKAAKLNGTTNNPFIIPFLRHTNTQYIKLISRFTFYASFVPIGVNQTISNEESMPQWERWADMGNGQCLFEKARNKWRNLICFRSRWHNICV